MSGTFLNHFFSPLLYTSFTDKNSTNTSTKKSGTIPTTTKMIKQVTKPLFGLVKHHVSCRFQISDLADGNNSEIAEELEVDPFSSLPPTMSSLMVPSAFTSFGASFDHQPSSMPNSPFHGSLTRKHRLSKMSSLNRESSQRSVSSAASFIMLNQLRQYVHYMYSRCLKNFVSCSQKYFFKVMIIFEEFLKFNMCQRCICFSKITSRVKFLRT